MKTWCLFCAAVVLSNACFGANSLPAGSRFRADYANLPVSFEANIGQADAAVEFLAHGQNGNLLLTRSEACLMLQNDGKENAPRTLRLKLSGANPNPKLEGIDPLPGKANYFTGNDSSRWRTDVSTFARVKYHDVYPGVDLIYYGNQQKLEYDLVVQPGANLDDILLEFSGAEKISLDADGDLLLWLGGNSVRQHKPIVYQEIGGVRRMLSGSYVLHSAMQVGFEIADYDKTKPLVIDPVLAYSGTFGGSGPNQALAVAIDANDDVYVAGNTTSRDFPTVGAFQSTNSPNLSASMHAFVTKFDTNGTIVYSTYLGGNASESAQGIAVDGNDNIFVTGWTYSTNFPTANALYPSNSGNMDAFVTEINSNGNALAYSTYFGGKSYDIANAIALDTNDDAIITGFTESTNLPTANPAQPVYGGNGDAFVAKFNQTGSALVYSTYLGGSGLENQVEFDTVPAGVGGALAVDFSGNAYVTGWTYSTNFPVLNAFQPKTLATASFENAAFVSKFDPSGNLVYSTYFGGEYGDFSYGIGVDFDGNVYFAGDDSFGGLSTTNAYQPYFGGQGNATTASIGDGFIAALDSTGTNLLYCTYLGGSQEDQINGIAVRPEDGAVAVTGFTYSPDFPLLDAVQTNSNQGLFKSVNAAASWNASNSGLIGGIIYSIQVDPSNPSTIYALTSGGCFKSTDGGATWNSSSSGLGSVTRLVLDPLHSGTLYAASGGVYKTTNGAASWTSASAGLPASPNVLALAIDPTTPSNLYLGTSGSGAYKSADGGNSWTQLNTGLANNVSVSSILVDPQNSSNVFLGDGSSSKTNFLKSANGGVTWTAIATGLPSQAVATLAFNPANSSTIYALAGYTIDSLGNSLNVSTNGGTNWSQSLSAQGALLTALAVGPSSASAPALTIASSGNNDILSWPVTFTNYTLQSTPSLNPAGWQNVAASNNGNNIITNPVSGAQGFYRLVGTNSSVPAPVLYVGTDAASQQGVLKSTDGGKTWSVAGLAGDIVNVLTVNPASPAVVYAGLKGKLQSFVSTFTSDGQLYFSTYLGGSGADQGNAIALDFDNAFVVGSTLSPDFPTTPSPNFSIQPNTETPQPQNATQPKNTASTVSDGMPCPDRNYTNRAQTWHTSQSEASQLTILPFSDKASYNVTGIPDGLSAIPSSVPGWGQDVLDLDGKPTVAAGIYYIVVTVKENASPCSYTITIPIIVVSP